MTTTLLIIKAIWDFLCKVFLWVLSNKRWSLIIVLVIYSLFQTWQSNSLSNDLNGTDVKCSAKIQNLKQTQQADLITAQGKVREAEQKAAQQVSEIENKLHEQNTKASDDQAKFLNDVRTGAISLRDRFTCPSTTNNSSNSVPNTAASASTDNAIEKRGLQREDAEFLISESNRADEIVRQLTSCQAMLIQERNNKKALK